MDTTDDDTKITHLKLTMAGLAAEWLGEADAVRRLQAAVNLAVKLLEEAKARAYRAAEAHDDAFQAWLQAMGDKVAAQIAGADPEFMARMDQAAETFAAEAVQRGTADAIMAAADWTEGMKRANARDEAAGLIEPAPPCEECGVDGCHKEFHPTTVATGG